MTKPSQWTSSKSPSDGVFEDADKLWGIPSEETKATVAQLLQDPPTSRRYAVIIVHYHRLDETQELLKSISGWEELPEQIFVAENSAPHYDWSFTRKLKIRTTVLSFNDNPGYGLGVNRAVKALPTDIPQFLILTHEVVLNPDCSQRLLDTLHCRSDVAVVAPLLRYKDEPDKIFSRGGVLSKRGRVKHADLGKRVQKSAAGNSGAFSVNWADGACLMMRRDVFEVLNGFDPRYFLYVEEIDYQFRARLAGGETVLNRGAQAYQTPSDYPLDLKYRNHIALTKKFNPHLHRWPWEWEIIRDLIRWVFRRTSQSPLGLFRFFPEWAEAFGSRTDMGAPRKARGGST